jgi:peptide subunit release factor 1 (eRF1)
MVGEFDESDIVLHGGVNSFREVETQAELEVQEKLSLLEWFANAYKSFGCTLEFVTNKSQVHINDTSWW